MVDRRHLLFAAGAATLGMAGAGWAGFRRMGTMEDYAADLAPLRVALPADPSPRDLIRFATLAANSHNTQAWQFRTGEGRIDVLPDLARRTPAVDPDDHHLFASLGCAAENLGIAAAARGQPGELAFDAREGGAVRFDFSAGASRDVALCDAIPHRQSTRADYDGSAVSAADLATLARAAALPGVDLILLTDRARINQLRDLVVAANTAQMADPAFVAELKHWLRFNPLRASRTGDGLFSATSGNPDLPDWLGPRMFDWAFTAKAENEKYAAQIASSAGIAVFVAAKADPEHWVLAGRACQRFALQATALGLKHAFLNQPVEVAAFRPDLAALLGLPGRRPDLVMRFGRGAAMPYSARRPVEAVLS
jgi:Nitroreductase family